MTLDLFDRPPAGAGGSDAFPPEPLNLSASFVATMAPWTCREHNGTRCDWYHGSWQLMRLLGLVSNPSWHREFIVSRLPRMFRTNDSIEVLISGCADYSTFAHVFAAFGSRAHCTVLDWCPTPLIATEWYARYLKVPQPELVVADACDYVASEHFDLIISDSFLPRFDDESRRHVLDAWRRSLTRRGRVVTTVRLHDRGERRDTGGELPRVEAWSNRAQAAETWWADVCPLLSHDELVERVTAFAERQERNELYSAAALSDLLTASGFKHVEVIAEVINNKRFAQVVAC